MTFKVLPSTRTKLVTWIKDAWTALSTTTIMAGFRNARIDAGTQPEKPVAPPCLVPDLGSMVMLLSAHEVTTETIDAAGDIEEAWDEMIV
ncbi:hypothetical protein PF003_g9327 [Phytophthora fragariae]|nr:hypothetical protein PF003_g9327 [Phytophthora fragariae]